MLDLNMSHEQMFDFGPFPLFGFTVDHKTNRFCFLKSFKYFNFFNKKRYDVRVRFEYVPWKNF